MASVLALRTVSISRQLGPPGGGLVSASCSGRYWTSFLPRPLAPGGGPGQPCAVVSLGRHRPCELVQRELFWPSVIRSAKVEYASRFGHPWPRSTPSATKHGKAPSERRGLTLQSRGAIRLRDRNVKLAFSDGARCVWCHAACWGPAIHGRGVPPSGALWGVSSLKGRKPWLAGRMVPTGQKARKSL